MTSKEKIKLYISKEVKVLLFDGKTLIGKLENCDTDEWKNKWGIKQKNYYAVGNEVFRASHIKKIEVIK